MKLLFTLVFLAFTAATLVNGQFLSYQNFNHKDGLNSASLNCIIQTNDGYIWLGTDGSNLMRYDGNSFEEIHFKNGDDNHHFSSFSIDGDNILFSSLYKGFYSFSRKSNSTLKLNEEKTQIGESLSLFRKDSIYYFVGSHGINFRNGKVYGSLFNKLDSQPSMQVYSAIETEKSVFLFTNIGGFKLSNGRLIPLSSLIKINSNDF